MTVALHAVEVHEDHDPDLMHVLLDDMLGVFIFDHGEIRTAALDQ